MEIVKNKLYENRTWKYLYPCLKHYDSLVKDLNNFFILAVGISDTNFEKNNSVYILIDTTFGFCKNEVEFYQNNFSKFLYEIIYRDYYVADYVFNDYSHMLVIKIPRIHFKTYKNFVSGEYSKMYTQKQIYSYFNFVCLKNKEVELTRNKEISNIVSVLNKDPSLIKSFVNTVNKDFKVSANIQDFLYAELDYPPIKKQEIFNYEQRI